MTDDIGLKIDNSKKEIYLVTTTVGFDISNSVGISWHCKKSGSYLLYKKEEDINFKKVEPLEEYWSIEESYMKDSYENKRYVCSANLKGLEPDTRYIYRIISGKHSSANLSFKTTSRMNSKYRFLSFVDFQYSENETTLKLINKFIEKNPETILITCSGDITDEGYREKSHRYLFDSNIFSNSILAFGVGDHEYWGTNKSPIKMLKKPYSYNKLFNNPKNGCEGYLNTTYYFKYNKTLFAFLDCGDSNVSSNDEMFCKQAKWLDKVLVTEKDYDFIIICMHKSLYGDPKEDSMVRQFAGEFTKIFDKHKVDLVISGHDHEYSRTKTIYNENINEQGTIYLDLGSSGNKARRTTLDIKLSNLYDNVIDIKENDYALGIVGTITNDKIMIDIYNQNYDNVDRVEIFRKNR